MHLDASSFTELINRETYLYVCLDLTVFIIPAVRLMRAISRKQQNTILLAAVLDVLPRTAREEARSTFCPNR